MIVKNLTTGKEWNDSDLDGIADILWAGFGYDHYFFLRNNVDKGEVLLIDGWFYYADPSCPNIEYVRPYIDCHKINALDACEILDKQSP